MYSFTLKHSEPSAFITGIADLLKVNVNDDAVLIKNNATKGYFKAITLENGIQCLCANYNTIEDFHLHKMPLQYKYFVLRIHEVSHTGHTITMADTRYSDEASTKNCSVMLLSSSEEFSFFASKKSQVKSLEILMPRRWFFNQLNLDCSDELLKNFLNIKNYKSEADFNNEIYRNLLLKVIGEANKNVLNVVYFEKHVNAILENFFWMFTSNLREYLEIEKVKISKDEMNRLIAVKKYLEQDIRLPQPTFSSLTKVALMSATTLKTKFKRMYGTSVFQYFQRMRMEKARILLLTHKFTVKQIGQQLGYTNMNNFTIAFKKEFRQLPSDLIN
jgi:AraC-like DNA-binding protein